MNLAIDIGNSSCKTGVYSADKKEYISSSGTDDTTELENIISRFPVKRAMISSVHKDDPRFVQVLVKAGIEAHLLSHNTPLPFYLRYDSPETLGSDRIAAVAAAHNMFRGANVLVIDAGTAVTIDLLGSDNVYLGGNISPGLQMRFRSLHDYTARLPLVSKSDSFGNLGLNTEESIRSGVQSGLIFEINDYIRTLKNDYKDLKIIFTGGDGEFLAANTDSSHELIPDLVIDGLNYILNYNAQTS
ncbi:MAG: type III pantothenate kinase [Bacteroidales bacterium]|nr:type III pantothenate kinase [Bacteroidales bacterium]